MTTKDPDRLAGIVSQLKLSAWWAVLASAYFGAAFAGAIWKPHDDFNPFLLLLWGAMAVFSLFRCRATLVGLTYSVALEEADATRTKTRGLFLAVCGAACISLSLGLCAIASKRFGGMFPIAAVVLLAALVLSGSLMHRAIIRLARKLTPERSLARGASIARQQFSGTLRTVVAGMICVAFLLTPLLVHSRPRYYAQYGLKYLWSYRQVKMDKRPRDCDWSASPVGTKNCHSVATVEESYVGKDVVTGEPVGMTRETTFPPTNWHPDHSHLYEPVVHVGWKREQN
jgi:hypothetical protein